MPFDKLNFVCLPVYLTKKANFSFLVRKGRISVVDSKREINKDFVKKRIFVGKTKMNSRLESIDEKGLASRRLLDVSY